MQSVKYLKIALIIIIMMISLDGYDRIDHDAFDGRHMKNEGG